MYDRGFEVMHTTNSGPEMIVMLAFWALLIVGVIFLVRFLMGNRTVTSTQAPKALEILEERFAKGEIDSKEFTEKRDVLTGVSDKPDVKE
jgi:putative membrane protein